MIGGRQPSGNAHRSTNIAPDDPQLGIWIQGPEGVINRHWIGRVDSAERLKYRPLHLLGMGAHRPTIKAMSCAVSDE